MELGHYCGTTGPGMVLYMVLFVWYDAKCQLTEERLTAGHRQRGCLISGYVASNVVYRDTTQYEGFVGMIDGDAFAHVFSCNGRWDDGIIVYGRWDDGIVGYGTDVTPQRFSRYQERNKEKGHKTDNRYLH
eukprot:545954-Rhodomonas_salina.2